MRGDAELEKLVPGAEGGGLLPLSEVDAQRKADDDVLNIGLGLMLRQKRVRDAGFPAIFRAYAGRLGLVDTVDGPTPAGTKVSAGHLVLATVLDTPGGRSPLYHLSDSFAGRGVESLIGAGIRPEDLDDGGAGRAPGRVSGAGTSKVFSPAARRAVEEFRASARKSQCSGGWKTAARATSPSTPKVLHIIAQGWRFAYPG